MALTCLCVPSSLDSGRGKIAQFANFGPTLSTQGWGLAIDTNVNDFRTTLQELDEHNKARPALSFPIALSLSLPVSLSASLPLSRSLLFSPALPLPPSLPLSLSGIQSIFASWNSDKRRVAVTVLYVAVSEEPVARPLGRSTQLAGGRRQVILLLFYYSPA